MTKEERFYRDKYPEVKELTLMDKEIIETLEEYAQQVNPETIKTVNPSAYWFNGRLVSFEDMKSRTVSDMDEIVPLYTMQLRKPKP